MDKPQFALSKDQKKRKNYYNDIALRLAKQIYHLDYLHYGYFDSATPQSMSELPRAQQLWVDRLLTWIPEGVKNLADVGCGTGEIARQLIEKGYAVTCVDPDPYMLQSALNKTNGRCGVVHARYEEAQELVDNQFDCVLMPESCQYIGPQAGWAQSARVVKPGGYVLICDFFKVRALDQPYLSKSGHVWDEFVKHARSQGFELIREQDITEWTAPTMDIYQDVLLNRAFPIAEGLAEVVRRRYPFVFKVGRWAFGKKVVKLRTKYHHQDSKTFKMYKSYKTVLFQKQR